MKLNKLRLLGFKSFVEPTDFQIEQGLTGVVGPNGCGKSNLVEALRWVMGETSHKSMRAAGMDDVIFSGTNNRPARNTAEVALILDNADRSAPAQFNDQETLEVSRRIEREKGSTYRVNGREVRARDVQLLFADASTGARSPALVHQGRIGEIIQAKPEQRRRVLEEAAGVAGLHARRHEAELRLKAAETNLNRLEDVIGQLATQIDALKRQARQAVQVQAGVGRRAQGRGDAVPSALGRGECRSRRRRATRKDVAIRVVAERDRRAGRGLDAAGECRRRPAAAARRGSEGRRGAAAPRDRARDARPRGSARQRAHRRTRPPARAARRGHRARAAPAGATPKRRLSGSRGEEAGLTQDGAGVAEREASVAARVNAAEAALQRGREDIQRTDRRARRSRRRGATSLSARSASTRSA